MTDGAVGIQGIQVTAEQHDAATSKWNAVATGYTSLTGTYSIEGLATGTYRIRFGDYSNKAFATEYYDSASTPGAAANVSVTAGATVQNIDAVLGLANPSYFDATPPTVTCNPSASYAVVASIAISASDNTAGSGVMSITYQLDAATPVTVTGASATVATSALGAHTLKVTATDKRFNTSAEIAKSFAVTPPTLSLTSSSATPAYDKAITLSATFGVGTQTIAFERSSGATWVQLDCRHRCERRRDAFGQALRPCEDRSHRARFDATSAYPASTSGRVIVTPQVYLTKGNAPATMRKGKAKTVTGYLKPRHTKGSKAVVIYRYKKSSNGKWKRYAGVHAKLANYKTYSKYVKSIKFLSKGAWN